MGVQPGPEPRVYRLACTIHVVKSDEGRQELEVRADCQTQITCKELTLRTPGGAALKLAVTGDQVAARGAFLHATADRIIQEQEQIVLRGHVQVTYHKDDQQAEVKAQEVVVGMRDGRLEIIPGTSSGSRATSAANSRPTAKAAPTWLKSSWWYFGR
jgi:hypothetical protein